MPLNVFNLSLIVLSMCFFSCTGEVENKETTNSDSITVQNESDIIDSSNITCPYCDFTVREELPTEYCVISYECKNCSEIIHPKVGDCCVFCTWGDVKCPSIQDPE